MVPSRGGYFWLLAGALSLCAVATTSNGKENGPADAAPALDPGSQPTIKALGKIDKDTIEEIIQGTSRGNEALKKFEIEPESLERVEVLKGYWTSSSADSGCRKLCFVGADGKLRCVLSCGMPAAPREP